ncbi:MAG: hypothetical protein VXY88_06525, partial [Bacteroidota bacterium]|nr:hypothetical protein [Bacteroidota bacterium]
QMKYIFLTLSFLMLSSCQNSKIISNEEVMTAFNNFFEILDRDLDAFDNLVTDDFFIFENSRRYSAEEFIEFVKTFDIVTSQRRFEDITIDADYNSAHLSLKHFGEFVVNTPEGKVKLEFEWLESCYLVKKAGELKFKFYFSEAIETNVTDLESN